MRVTWITVAKYACGCRRTLVAPESMRGFWQTNIFSIEYDKSMATCRLWRATRPFQISLQHLILVQACEPNVSHWFYRNPWECQFTRGYGCRTLIFCLSAQGVQSDSLLRPRHPSGITNTKGQQIVMSNRWWRVILFSRDDRIYLEIVFVFFWFYHVTFFLHHDFGVIALLDKLLLYNNNSIDNDNNDNNKWVVVNQV